MPDVRIVNLGEGVPPMIFKLPDGMNIINLTATTQNENNLFKKLNLNGAKNFAFIGDGSNLKDLSIKIKGKSNTIYIGRNCTLKGCIDIASSGSVVAIGAYTTFNNVNIFAKMGQSIFIGKDCMFSSGIEVRTSDSHSVVDITTMKRHNNPKGVVIGDHVWVGKGAVIQRGCQIADDNIVGINSLYAEYLWIATL